MKILYIIERIEEGGKERRLLELIKWLSTSANYEIVLVVMENNIYYSEFYNLNISIKFIFRKSKYDFAIFIKLYSFCKQIRPDLIHTWGSIPSLYVIPAVYLLAIPLLDGQITGAPSKIKKCSKLWFIKNITFYFAKKIVSNSLAGLQSYKAPLFKSIHIYNGFDFSRLKKLVPADIIKRELNITTKHVVGMVASFSDSKDYNTFFMSAIDLCRKRSDVTFISAGSGKKLDFYKKIIREAQLERNILFLGKVTNIEDIINIFDIGILTSYTEGISNSILEYMALKKAVIATDCPGNREIISDRRDGILNPIEDINSLLINIEILLNDTDMREYLGSNAHNKVKLYFNKRRMLDSFINVYKTVIEDDD